MGIVVGSVVDGVPESLIFGIQIGTGTTISLSFLAAVFVSNIPQALAPSADLVKAGWKTGASRPALDGDRARLRRRLGPRLPCDRVAARCLRRPGAALAAGGLLAMLTNSLIPFAYDRGKEWAGAATVVGFCLAMLGT